MTINPYFHVICSPLYLFGTYAQTISEEGCNVKGMSVEEMVSTRRAYNMDKLWGKESKGICGQLQSGTTLYHAAYAKCLSNKQMEKVNRA